MAELDPTSPEYVNNPWVVEARQARAYQTGSKEFGGGGRYELSEDELEAMIKRLDAVSDKIDDAMKTAQPMRQIRPPGDDPCSRHISQVMNTSGDNYLTSLENQRSAVMGLRDQMQATLDRYRGVEHTNRQAVRGASTSVDNGEL